VASVRATVRDLRRVNRTVVLRPLFFEGPLNRVLLSQLTGLSSGSVTNVISDLLEEELVVEAGTEESDGGRPRVLLRVNPEFGVVIGVDVGETRIRVEGFDLAMQELAGSEANVHPQGHDASDVVEWIAEAVVELQSRFAAEGRRVLGVGVAVPGVVEHDRDGHVHAPGIGWHAIPLGRLLRECIELPLFVENGAKTLGQAEMWLGAGRGTRHTVVTLWGTGVGAAIFADGVLYRGAASSAGEWGHTNSVLDGKRCRCGAAGCLEAYVGAEALLREWARVDPAVELPTGFDQEEWIERLVARASAGEPAAAGLLETTATHFGLAAANLVNLFNPERIVVGGWAGLKLGPALLPMIREVIHAQALEYAATRVTVELGQLGKDAVALGASTLVVEDLLASGGQPPQLLGGRRPRGSL
jgi:predicted NBD/HSP70 family sugar kinase